MVAIIRCTGDELEQLDWNESLHARRGQEWVWQPTRRRRTWDSGSHLTAILAPSATGVEVSRLGWTIRLRPAGDIDQVLEVSRIEPVDPAVPYSSVEGRLSGRHKVHLKQEGCLSKATGEALVAALIDERPGLREIIARIEGVADKYPIGDSPSGQVMALQRDASIVAVQMAGMDVSDFARWDRPRNVLAPDEVPPTFVGRIQGGRALEDEQVSHDSRTMLGWLTNQTQHVSWREFTGFGQRLFVANANHDTAERTLGVDLIYYSETRGSMVLVQYKRLDAAKNGFYYPNSDSKLARELIRMRAVDRYVAGYRKAEDDFRFVSSPCWLKICQPQAYIPQTADMVPGMYLSLDHFDRLRADPRLKGPHGGTRFGYANVPNYLDNSMFSRLVETGFIGSSGTATDLVYKQVIRSFRGHKALVLATLHGDDMTQSKRNTQKRSLRRQT
jgi:hypothetical protein